MMHGLAASSTVSRINSTAPFAAVVLPDPVLPSMAMCCARALSGIGKDIQFPFVVVQRNPARWNSNSRLPAPDNLIEICWPHFRLCYARGYPPTADLSGGWSLCECDDERPTRM